MTIMTGIYLLLSSISHYYNTENNHCNKNELSLPLCCNKEMYESTSQLYLDSHRDRMIGFWDMSVNERSASNHENLGLNSGHCRVPL